MKLFPEAAAIDKKIQQLKGILEITQLTVSQIYEEEFKGTGRGEIAFGTFMTKLISQKLGGTTGVEQKKARTK